MFHPRHLLPLLFALLLPLCAQQMDLARTAAVARISGNACTPVLLRSGATQYLQLQAIFNNGSSRRACWDIPFHLDLSQVTGLRLKLCCRNPELVSQFQIHIRAGGIWQNANFEINGESWCDILIPKSRFTPEGEQITWRDCDLLRISAWKGGIGPATLFLLSLEFVQPNSSIAVLTGDDATLAKESQRYLSALCEALLSTGLHPAILHENDIGYSTLLPYKMLLVPFPEALSPDQISNLVSYIRRGGRIGVFHNLPPRLAAALDMPAGRYIKCDSPSLAMTGIYPDPRALPAARGFRQQTAGFIGVSALPMHLRATAWWKNAQGSPTTWPAILEGPSGFWMTQVYRNEDQINGARTLLALIAKHLPNAPQMAATTLLQDARLARSFAGSHANQDALQNLALAEQNQLSGNLPECLDRAQEALQAFQTGPVQKTVVRADELRAAWCQNHAGLSGRGWA
ncbi:MAG: hypothetical protein IJJ26_06125, partial [Victivallales bacterium]|nr:hypothetical protein [Victivallales bacterium]